MSSRTKSTTKSKPIPCNLQGTTNKCCYYSVRTAVELLLKRPFNKAEKSMFQTYHRLCPRVGDIFSNSIAYFTDMFEAMNITFTRVPAEVTRRRTRRSKGTDAPLWVTVDQIEQALLFGPVLLNVQNMDFSGNRVVHGVGSAGGPDGHCICCYDSNVHDLILKDTNAYRGSCIKLLSKDDLQRGIKVMNTDYGYDRDKQIREQKSAFFISEMYILSKKTI